MASSTPQSQASMLATITTDLDKIAPRFEIQPEQITIIQTPTEFYETLKEKVSKAQRRIYLSTLYIGKTEHEFISTIRNALAKNPDLRVSFLTDSLRGTRETPEASTASLLVPLITEFGPERVEVRMYHTPNLTGLRKKYIPKRINEGWGLQHMKLYGVDDEIIMSGANLSSDYFSNRQDRYHLFHSKELTEYFSKIHSGVASLSFDLQPSTAPESGGYTMSWPSSNPAPSPLDSPSKYRDAASKHLSHFLLPSNSPKALSTTNTSTTTIYPILSLVPLLATSTELPALTHILTSLARPPLQSSSWTFTAGYFNMTPSFRRMLLATHPVSGTVLTAHPHANGFFGSKGVSGMLPAAYTHLAKQFLRKVRHEGLEGSVRLKEWQKGMVGEKEGWTYHAKGLWVTFPSTSTSDTAAAEEPSLTVVGSSNYTKRSYELDLEANVVIATSDPGLRKRLGEEVKWLGEYAKEVDESEFEKPERRVGMSVRLSMWLVRVLGGAL
ncbi:CDP-diacylglycerol--glycerol-3-phosphate 3-phosphatidyltransferase [Parastagonospora nodorum]|nr:CDP-diacylglycerol--glycerol-3-phosphate 3-phosphatidyltransferase [Parastagonospora nodorum]KAH3984285.1 CDP-diacylglycerol--glycerol-3-phosphate 3-phosphatidyltransferase [Parastagonospora nodorum]KAH4000462.1 CDP-diacylglycerol--glycerol-3-phosphate 3-phosphatidyltransferase [Parastagonospora nodorum]KAH4026709.1 CDP-diacylglycerol--glycerol-3-phosphate 3-phosphatidyltransferase [Parastagonospora nodorum]KAH4051819.1 CDP-diacylglycerol--glycerol-3-phosphate 3-phosphatidyltransferase [Para